MVSLEKERGQHLGRPKAEIPAKFDELYASWKRGEITATKGDGAARLEAHYVLQAR